MLIVEENFVEGGTVTASSEAAAMPASNLKILQPSVRHRMTTITGDTWIEVDLRVGSQFILGYDVVALIGYDGAPSRNMLRAASSMTTGWTITGANLFSYSGQPPDGYNGVVADFVSQFGGAMHAVQTVTKQVSGTLSLPVTLAVIAKTDVTDIDVKLRLYSTDGVHECNVDFDLSAGTAGAVTEIGDFTDDGATITALSDDYYLCTLSCTTDSLSTVTVAIEGIAPIITFDYFALVAPVLMLQEDYPTASDLPTEYPITDHNGSGPMWDVRRANVAAPSILNGEVTGWMSMATRNALKEFPRFNTFVELAELEYEGFVRLALWDRDNELAYIEVGHLVIGKSIDLSTKLRTITLEAEESGGQQEAHGGQIYRPQRKVRRRLRLEMVALTKAQAMDSIYFLNRVKGRSRQILVIAQPDDPVYAQEQMIYGYIDSLDPIPSKASHSGDYWTWGMTMIETP